MITRWKVFNFKSIRKETELDLAPLTIFAGANSSGKSAFLQSILLVAQTLSNRISSRSVVLNGALVRLGQFDDIRSANSASDQIRIGWTLGPGQRQASALDNDEWFGAYSFLFSAGAPTSVSCEIAFDAASPEQQELAQIQPLLFSTRLSSVVRNPDGSERKPFVAICRDSPPDEFLADWYETLQSDDPVLHGMLYGIEMDDESLAEIQRKLDTIETVHGCVLRHFLPEQVCLWAFTDMAPEDTRLILATVRGDDDSTSSQGTRTWHEVFVPQKVLDFLMNIGDRVGDTALRGVYRASAPYVTGPEATLGRELFWVQIALNSMTAEVREELRRQLAKNDDFEQLVDSAVREDLARRDEGFSEVRHDLPSVISEATIYTERFLTEHVRYLGPLRDEPKSLYPLGWAADLSDTGLRGENTAAVLEVHKNRLISYIPAAAFAEGEVQAESVDCPLGEAVVDWLHYLGVADSVESRDRGKLGHELKVSIAEGETPHDLTHVGVGVSQVLPILVSSLLAEPDTTLVFEQPELHLHPRVQTRLADFFLSMTQLGKQCVIETHSEYLINRVRFRVAAATSSNPWLEAVKVYFVERGEAGSVFRTVDLNEYGAILDWPEGFFDQSQYEAEAILRAAAAKRKAKREK